MARLSLYGFEDNEISPALFGGNFLSTSDGVGNSGTFDEVAQEIGLTHLRYPGGSLTEHYFDITNPDAAYALNEDTRSWVFLTPMSEFFEFAAEQNASVTVVLPTQKFLSEARDANGNRFANVDHDALRTFIADTLNGVYGDVDIQAFEIGNEYWGSGEMTSVEYGRVAADMSVTVQSVLNELDRDDVDIAVQMGSAYVYETLPDQFDNTQTGQEIIDQVNAKYGTDFGAEMINSRDEVMWSHVANGLIMHEFDTVQEQESIDAIISHVYSRAPYATYSRDYHLDIAEMWHDEYEGLTNYVTEWNVSSNTSLLQRDYDYGLKQAHEYLNLITNFADRNVEVAHVWAVQQSAEAALATSGGDVKVLGEMFSLMSESLQGAQIVDINPSDSEAAHITDSYQTNAFYNDGNLVLFVSSLSLENEDIALDLNELISSFDTLNVTSLSVGSPEQVGDADAVPVVTENPINVSYENGEVAISANPYEVIRLEFTNTVMQTGEAASPLNTQDTLPLDDAAMGLEDGVEDALDPDLEEIAELMGESLGLAGVALFLPLLLLL